MKKREIVIPKSLIKNLLIGFSVSYLMLVIVHLFSHYTVLIKDRYLYSLGDKTVLSTYYMECPFGETHSFNGQGIAPIEVMDGKFSTTKLVSSFQGVFGHPLLLIMVCAVITIITQLNFKITIKDEQAVIGNVNTDNQVAQKNELSKEGKWIIGIIIVAVILAITYPAWIIPFWKLLDKIFS